MSGALMVAMLISGPPAQFASRMGGGATERNRKTGEEAVQHVAISDPTPGGMLRAATPDPASGILAQGLVRAPAQQRFAQRPASRGVRRRASNPSSTSHAALERATALIFFSFDETDRWPVWRVRNLAMDRNHPALRFEVGDLYQRWAGASAAAMGKAIAEGLGGTSRTIVFVGENTHASEWVGNEVQLTLAANRPVFAIRVPGVFGPTPDFLADNGITVHDWSEPKLQQLATA